ncbi:MAG: hypothetical protein AB8B99_01255 [Phormidesmis sp.]
MESYVQRAAFIASVSLMLVLALTISSTVLFAATFKFYIGVADRVRISELRPRLIVLVADCPSG